MINETQSQLTNATAKELRDLQDRIISVLNHRFERAINDVKSLTWIAKEGREVFEFEAKDLNEAEMACEMWNAVLIGLKEELGISMKMPDLLK